MKDLFDLLCSRFETADIRRTTGRTLLHTRSLIATVVADQLSIVMFCQCDIAVWTLKSLPTGTAENLIFLVTIRDFLPTGTAGNKARVPAPVQEQDGLLIISQTFLQGTLQFTAQDRTVPCY